MIDAINEKLALMGSNFRTDDGKTLVLYVGGLVFLTRHFSDPAAVLAWLDEVTA